MKLIFRLYDFHQRLNNIFTWFPLKWDHSRKNWQCISFLNPKSTLSVYILLNIVCKLILLTSAASIVTTELKNPGLFGFVHVLTESIVILMILCFSMADYIVLKYGNILVFACNWTLTVDKHWKISKKQQVLILKVLTISIVSLSLLGYFWIIVFTYLELDPFDTIAKYLFCNNTDHCSYLVSFYPKVWFKLICSITYLFMFHLFLSGLLNLILLTFSEGLYRLMLLKNLQQHIQPNIILIQFYRQFKIVDSVLKPFEYDISTAVLSGVFVTFLVFSNVFFFALGKHLYVFMVISLGLLCLTIGFLHILFVLGCSYYMLSFNTLFRWKANMKSRNSYLCRVLKSMKSITVPAGEAGIIDNEIKANYFYSLLINSTNSIITMRSIL